MAIGISFVSVLQLKNISRNRSSVLKYTILFVFILFFSLPLQAQIISDAPLVVYDIQIYGNRTTKDYVIRREMSIKIGDTLTQAAIELDRNNIYNLLLFNKVDIDYAVQQNHATVFVIVSERWYFIPYPIIGMKYRDPHKLYYGVGVAHVNFRGRNEKVYGNVGFGYDRWLSLNYQNPKVTDGDDIFINTAFTLQKVHSLSNINGEYENSNIFLSGAVGKRFGMYQTLSGTLGYEVWQVTDSQLNRTISPSGRDAFLTTSVQYRYDTRDNHEYATDGSFVLLILRKNGLGDSGMDLTGFSYDIRRFLGFGKGNSFGIRTTGLFTWGGKIPSYKHVFFGYDERIRGYFYKSIEGENRIGANIEIRLPILLPRYLEINAFALIVLTSIFLNIYRSTKKYLLDQKLYVIQAQSTNALI